MILVIGAVLVAIDPRLAKMHEASSIQPGFAVRVMVYWAHIDIALMDKAQRFGRQWTMVYNS